MAPKRKISKEPYQHNDTLPLRRSTRKQQTPAPAGASSAKPIITPSSPPPSQRPELAESETTGLSGEASSSPPSSSVAVLPAELPSKLPGLTKHGVKLLKYKQKRLQSSTSQIHRLHEFFDVEKGGEEEFEGLKRAVDATLVFAQEEAGTAVCISPSGLLLTCSHCVAEVPSELDLERIWWLLFASGQIVQAKCVKWDPRRDLALLRIVATQHTLELPNSISKPSPHAFPYTSLPPSPYPSVPQSTPLLCTGHPGSEDLEAGTPGLATGYDVLHISEGKSRGYAKGQDVQDNSEIGALMHDCWTYWGHSGAPLVLRGEKGRGKAGMLVGLHSSWDENTGMRRGVGLEALRSFLEGIGEGEGM
ncbi:trypsin-like cysteine/serine peptidase domain-containing protein [Clohesyomyces aquaticus]|uniref:Trypsin-like cysteine/serine peptidase domain-containing protein n=1 Tax=Clohesyomyces aquaticus TaxID=1231657 RepID=A0A1Y1YQR3_9PLEO|nr:trypsin-like cysteine/serine peptidase domain-containing protein [Clohesyomyces aquaticus]